jgi:hypothetical protein
MTKKLQRNPKIQWKRRKKNLNKNQNLNLYLIQNPTHSKQLGIY